LRAQGVKSASKENERMLKQAKLSAAIFVLVFLPGVTVFSQSSGADTFKAKCAVCHGNDGLASAQVSKALGVRSYKDPVVLKMSDADLTAVIKNGKNNKMPAFGAQLTDAQIKDVLKYVHSLQK
jgi:cytochrome c6